MSDPLKSTKVTESSWKRVGDIHKRVMELGVERLPADMRLKLRDAMTDSMGRRRAIPVRVVWDLALDALESLMKSEGDG